MYEQSAMAETEQDRAMLPPGGAGLSTETGETIIAIKTEHCSSFRLWYLLPEHHCCCVVCCAGLDLVYFSLI